LPAVDGDIADMEKRMDKQDGAPEAQLKVDTTVMERAIREILGEDRLTPPPSLADFHLPPKSFARGKPLLLEATLTAVKNAPQLASVRLRYRRVNQAEGWQSLTMEAHGDLWRAVIPAEYTDSPFPLQYHFAVHPATGAPWLHPGLRPGWHGQPYF